MTNDSVPLVDNIVVSHTAFKDAIRRMNNCYEHAGEGEPGCLAIIGESRTGKTRALDTFWRRHRPVRLEDGMHVPVLRVKAPSKPTVKGLAELMLDHLRAPDPGRGTENEKTRRLKILMRNTQTRMILIDEFQHFIDKGTKAVMHHVADWLKILVDDLKCALVVAGLPSCTAVIGQNEQLAGRFLAPVYLSRFNWDNIDDREEFKKVLQAFHTVLREHYDVLFFHDENIAFRFFCATGGLIGYVKKLLRQAVWNATSDNKKCITLQDLDTAHVESMWTGSGPNPLLRPFSRDFQPVMTRDVLAQVLRIGTISPPSDPGKRSPSRTPRRSVGSYMVAG